MLSTLAILLDRALLLSAASPSLRRGGMNRKRIAYV